VAGSGAGVDWVAGITDNQPGIGWWLEDVVDAVKYGVKLSHGVAELLDICLKVTEGLVVA